MKHSSKHAANPQAKQLPAIHWKTFLADDVRVEADGKVSVLGMFADDKILVNFPPDMPDPSEAAPIAIEGICILSTVFNLPITTAFEMELRSPSGHLVAKGSTTIHAGPVINTISKFRPLAVRELGPWKLLLKSDAFQYEYNFEILRQLPMSVPAAAKKAMAAPKRRTRA